MIRLSAQELGELSAKHKGFFELQDAVAQAQLKKVVEDIKAHSEWQYVLRPKEDWLYEPINDKYRRVGVTISAEYWQALLKECEE